MPNLIGQSIGRYHILEQLGEGGMATVYKAFDTRLERDVAIKVIRRSAFPPEQLERILKRFEREAKALARLSHPNILKVLDYGEHEGSPYLVLEYLPGGTLKQRMGQPTGWRDALTLMLPVIDALAYAHEHKIIHRDIKPSNILLAEKGQPLLTDFGIAKILDLEEGQTLTGTGVGVGTPEYMAPEQGMGKEVDARADIYSLGIVLYELLTGQKPYTADTPMAVVFKHMTDPLPRPTQFTPGLPDGVEKLLLKALAKQPEDRYENMNEFIKGMRTCLETPSDNVSRQIPGNPNTIASHDEKTIDQFLISAKSVVKEKPARRFGLLIAIPLVFVGFIVGGWLLWPKPVADLPSQLSTETEKPTIVETPSQIPADTPTPPQITTPFLSISATPQDTSTPSKTPDRDASILFYEDFEDGKAQQITYSDQEWNIVSDETGNKVYDVDNSKGNDFPRIHLGSNSWRDYEITFRARIISGSWIIIYFRENESTNNTYLVDIRSDDVTLNYATRGSDWKRITSRQHNWKRNEWYLVTIQAKGSEIKVTVNDTVVIFTDDTKYTYGRVNIQVGQYTHAQFDDIKVISVEK
jgi:serine/threonine protein kinase